MDTTTVGLKDKFNSLKDKVTGTFNNKSGRRSQHPAPDNGSQIPNPEPPQEVTPGSNYSSLKPLGKAVIEMLSGGGLGGGKWSLTKHYDVCKKYGIQPYELIEVEQMLGAYPLYNDSEEAELERRGKILDGMDEEFLNYQGQPADQRNQSAPSFGRFGTYDTVNEDARSKAIENGQIEGGSDFRPLYEDRLLDYYNHEYETEPLEPIEGKDSSTERVWNPQNNNKDLRYKNMWSPPKEMVNSLSNRIL